MKIMVVTPYFYPKVGGLENYALNTTLQLQQAGHEVFVVTSNHAGKQRVEETVQGLRVIRLPRAVKLSNTPINPAWRWQLKAIIKAEKPDVINAHTPVPYIADMAARAAGRTPFVLTYHNDLMKASLVGNTLAKLFYILLSRRTLKRADRIIATSAYYAAISPYLQKHKAKVSIVSPGVDTTRLNPSIDKTWLKQQYPGKKVVLFVGSMLKSHSHKGVDVLIRAVADARKIEPNLHLVLVGQGDAIADYQQLAATLGLQDAVTFTGFASDDDLPKYYAGAAMLVLPSTSNLEGFGMVLAEAQACGTPVIGTKMGGIPYAMQDGKTGYLVESKDPIALSHAVRRLLTDPTAAAFGANATAYISQNFAWPALSQQYGAILHRASLPKVCLVHNIISPYRLPVYEEINKQVNLTVLFCKPITKDRKWSYDLSKYTFNYRVLKGFALGPVIFNTNALPALLKTRFDVIMANNDPDVAPTAWLGFLLAKLRKRKIVCWSLVTDSKIHFFSSIAYTDDSLRRFVRDSLSVMVMGYRTLCHRVSDRYLAFSNHAKLFLQDHGINGDLITRTYQVMPSDLLPEPTIQPTRTGRTFLSIGYLNSRKGLSYMIDAFMQLPDPKATLIIAGTGPVEQQLKAQAAADKRIQFAGYVQAEARANLYASADVFILPTLLDVWGLVVNEAIHYGCAVICSDAAEAKDLITPKSGLIVPAANAAALTQAMQQLLDNPQLMQTMQQTNRNNATVSNTSLAADGYITVIREVLR